MTIAITANTSKPVYSPEANDIQATKNNLPENNTNPAIIKSVTENKNAGNITLTDEQIGDKIRSHVSKVMPVLLTDYDTKWMQLAIELCKVLSDDSLNQLEQRNKLEERVVELAKQLKDLKYKEADIQVRAAVSEALISVAAAVIGTAGDMGKAISGVMQSAGQAFSKITLAEATRLQGDAEVIRARKEILLSSMSAHNKVSDDQKELKKKFMDMVSRYFDNRQATAGNLINNMRT